MEKKIYLAPEAELVVFYSEEDIANLNSLDDSDDELGGSGSGFDTSISTPDNDFDI